MKKRIFKELLHNKDFKNFIISLLLITFFCLYVLIDSHKALFPYKKRDVIESSTVKEIDEINDKTVYRTTFYFESESELYIDKMCSIESDYPIDNNVKYVYTDYNGKGKCYTSKPFNYTLFIVITMPFIISVFMISLFYLPQIIKFLIESYKRIKKIRGDENGKEG